VWRPVPAWKRLSAKGSQTTGTKVFLALFAVIVGVLVVYYGVIVPGKNPANGAPKPGVVANNAGKAEESSGTTHPAVEVGAGGRIQQAPPRTSPPPRQPAAVAPQAAPVPPNASTAGGLLSEGVREATGESAPANPHSMALHAPERPTATPSIANPLLPLVGLNGGDFTPTGLSAPKNDGATSPPSERSTNATDAVAGATPPVEPPHARTEYVIVSGDTFVSIAEAWLGDETRWSLIARENPTVDPQRLKIGQRIFLPPKDAASTAAPPPPTVAAGETIHTVESGETLIEIAREVLDDGSRWEEIHRLNRTTIGDDPAALKVGMKLRLPRKSLPRNGE
jgi:nucleoid-associated protein YgaU